MSYYLNADEVFKIGVEIEANGREFYGTAANRLPAGPAADLCRTLASWEQTHIELFERLRRDLPTTAREGGAFDPTGELAGYVKALADTHVFATKAGTVSLAEKCKTGIEVLDLALTFEKDSVALYTAMKKIVDPSEGQAEIDKLIDEELRHISILSTEKAKLAS